MEASGTIGAAEATVSGGANGKRVAVQVTGTFVATLQFEGTVNGVDWVALQLSPTDGTADATSTTGVGAWYSVAPGLGAVRVRASAYTSGTASVFLRGE